MSLTKTTKPKTEEFFSLKTCWVFWGFEQLSRQSSVELCHRKDMCKLLDLGWNHTDFEGVNLLYTKGYNFKDRFSKDLWNSLWNCFLCPSLVMDQNGFEMTKKIRSFQSEFLKI